MKSPGAHVEDLRGHIIFEFLWLVLYSFGPPSSTLVVYYLERGEMSLHDAVGTNSKNDATTEYEGAGRCLVYGLRGVCWLIMSIEHSYIINFNKFT